MSAGPKKSMHKFSMRQNFSEADMNRYVEEDAITEMGQVSVLSASSFSLKHRPPMYLDKKTSIYVTSQIDLHEEEEAARNMTQSREEKKKMTKLEMIRHMRGFIYVVIYAIFFSLSGIFIKRAYLLAGSDNSIIRYVLQLVTMFALTKLKGISCFGPRAQWGLLSLRGFIGQLSVMALHFSLTLIAPSDTIAITNSSLIVASVLAWIFLKEKLTIAHIVAVFLTITGVVLISQPTFIFGEKNAGVVIKMFNCSLEQVGLVGANRTWPVSNILEALEEKRDADSISSAVQTRCLNELIDQYRIKLENITMYGLDHYDNESDSSIMYILEHAPNIKRSSLLFYLGILFALVYSFGSGAVQVIIKKLCMQKVHFAVATIYSSYFGIPCSIIVSAALFLTGTSHKHFNYELHFHLLPLQIFYSIASALCGIFSQVCLNLALNYEDASKISILKSLDLLFTFVLQFAILRIEPDWMSCAGAALILAGSTAVVTYKIIENKRNERKKVKKDALLKASERATK